ncbi:hypothetical protein BZA77DRAFT_70392 [Pyronema omphalodes]|nr:hypothetical protein BZA77DRAFT_70392 [Pyronema omphalodes]
MLEEEAYLNFDAWRIFRRSSRREGGYLTFFFFTYCLLLSFFFSFCLRGFRVAKGFILLILLAFFSRIWCFLFTIRLNLGKESRIQERRLRFLALDFVLG